MYLLDANAFIEPPKLYYPFDVVPAYWDLIRSGFDNKAIQSIDKVKAELKDEDMQDWLTSLEKEFFLSTKEQDIIAEYDRLSTIIIGKKYPRELETDFLSNADSYLIACAKARNAIVVTFEKPSRNPLPNNVSKIQIPDICNNLNVACISPIEMLRREKIIFTKGKEASSLDIEAEETGQLQNI